MTLIKWSKPNVMGKRNDPFSWPFSVFDDFLANDLGGSASFVPAVNISEKPENFLVEVSAPGFKKEDFKIEAEDGTLSISAEHKEEKSDEGKQFTRREFRYGSFSRSFTLPENIKVEGIQARYNDGILNVELPKKELEQKPAVKEIKVS
ncbi:MAG TPA: Hsp20/alpha crystallin family protein [Bacteroidia bacterium]|jgi:HSP20 family protein|nr:Hsp20/alpha crystallin family protein [Bacteroidia bacterium]